LVHRKLASVTTEISSGHHRKSAPVTTIHNPAFQPHQTPHQNPETRNNPKASKQPRNTETHPNYQPISSNPKRPRAGFSRIWLEILTSLPDTPEIHTLLNTTQNHRNPPQLPTR
jgi:hypothetical protein